LERDLLVARVTRAKLPVVWGFPDRSRDVLLPGETRLHTEGPTIWTCQGLPIGGKMLMGYSPVERNRERELGLDRRETG
jgi:hypothetical protein